MSSQHETLRLLLELEDERTRSRRRESVFVSVIAHLAVIIFLLIEPTIFKSVRQRLGVEETPRSRRQVTFLAQPPDDQRLTAKPKTNILSDKDRLARPGVDVAPPKLPPLPPRPIPAPPAEKPAEKPLVAQTQPPPGPPPPTAQPQGAQNASELQLSDLRNEPPKLAVPATPGRSLEESLRTLARNRAGGGQAVGDGVNGIPGGGNPRAPASLGEARILSDTMGVDFDPYLRRVVADIRRNWYAVIPEIARLGKRGRVVVVFEIIRDGGVPKLYLVASSNFEPLDRAALAGISASVPFPPLPAEFRGPMIRLQVTFLYNMFGLAP